MTDETKTKFNVLEDVEVRGEKYVKGDVVDLTEKEATDLGEKVEAVEDDE